MAVLPWAYSRLSQAENCPHQYYRIRIKKDIKESFSEDAQEGIEQHGRIENYLRGKLEPSDLKPHHHEIVERVVTEGKRLLGEPTAYVELKLGIRADGSPCQFFDKSVWLRGVLDYLQVAEEDAFSVDWKNGKPRTASDQLKCSSLLIFAHFPKVQMIRNRFVFLNHNKIEPEIWRRWMQGEIMNEFKKRVQTVIEMEERDYWPKKKSGLCKNHCAVRDCEHNGHYVPDGHF